MMKFITVEGGEGSGKTSLIKRLCVDLEKDNIAFLLSREPGGSRISEDIRSIILNKENTNMNYIAEAFLYAASRAQHVSEVIKPAIEKNLLVICDRYLDASLAYQGYARGLGINKVLEINKHAIDGIMPTLTIYIDVEPSVGLSRIKNNHREMDRLDLEKIAFHKKVRNGYLEVSKMFSDRVVVIDGHPSFEEVYQTFKDIIYKKYGL